MADKRSNPVPTHLTDQQLAGLDEACRAAERASAPGAKVTRSSYLAALLDAEFRRRADDELSAKAAKVAVQAMAEVAADPARSPRTRIRAGRELRDLRKAT